jgi:hypothetical protein
MMSPLGQPSVTTGSAATIRELRPPSLVLRALAFEVLRPGAQAARGGEGGRGQARGHEERRLHRGPASGVGLDFADAGPGAGIAVSVEMSTETQSFPPKALTSATDARTGMVAASMCTSPGPTAGRVTLRSSGPGSRWRSER